MYSLSMLVAACNSPEVVPRLVVTQNDEEVHLHRTEYEVSSLYAFPRLRTCALYVISRLRTCAAQSRDCVSDLRILSSS